MDNANNQAEEKSKILIVDDDRSNIAILDNILRPTYSTLFAISGKTAIDAAEKTVPDLILLDIIMPDMSGFEVLAELKRNRNLEKIPVIFITALDDYADEEKGFALGAVDYIRKPFSGPIVKARLKTHLRLAKYIREIERFGITDTLTELPNRRAFNDRIKLEWARASRSKEPLGLIMIDSDNFKAYNDKYGHMQGDVLLQAIAGVFAKNAKRASDFAARWGGEEFVVLLPNTNIDMAMQMAERIRHDVENTVIPLPDGTATRTTISLGVNSEIPAMDNKLEDFINKADAMLYKAKKEGKNRVC